jgi:hypothetical protein
MLWYLENGVFDTRDLTESEIHRRGDRWLPFDGKPEEPGVVRCSVRSALDLEGLFFGSFRYSDYAPAFSGFLLYEEYQRLGFSDFQKDAPDIISGYGGQVFVRPDEGHFRGKVVDKSNFRSLPGCQNLILSKPKRVGPEYRFVVFRDMVLCGSTPTQPVQWFSAIQSAAQGIVEASCYKPEDQMWVMDLCTFEGKPKVVRLNAFSVSDLYFCDRRRAFEPLDEIV